MPSGRPISNEPSENGLAEYLLTGAEVFADRERLAEIEAFHLGRIQLDNDNEGYVAIVQALTGMGGEDAAKAYRRAVERYDKPLTLADVARELDAAPEAVRNAVANQTGRGVNLPARVVGLAHGRTIPRETLEERHAELRSIVDEWSSR